MRAVFALSAVLLLALAAPSAAARDGAELAAAGASLGVAHPTGFVLDVLVWRVAMLVPIGDLAFRSNAITALWGASALALVAWLTLVWQRWLAPEAQRARLVSAGCAALLVASSSTVLRATTAVEVYASALCLSLALLAWLPGRAPASTARALALGSGLSFATHTSVRAAVVAAALALLWTESPRDWLRARALLAWAALAALSIAVVLYLPLSAAREPWVDWGGPNDLRSTLAHLSAARIRTAFSQQMGGSMSALSEAISVLRADLGAPVLLAAVVGAGLALRDRSTLARSVALATVLDLLYSVLVNPMGTRDRQTLFLTEAGAAVLCVRAVFSLAMLASSRRDLLAIGACCSLAIGALWRADLRFSGAREGWTAVEVYGGPGALGALAPRSVVLCESDELCGGSLFARVCEGERPDVVVLPRQHLWDRTTWRRLRVALGRAAPDRHQPRAADEALRVRRMRSVLSVFGERVRWEQGDRADERLAQVSMAASESPVLARPVRALDPQAPSESFDAVSRWLLARESDGVLARRIEATVLFSAGMRASQRALSEAAPFWRRALERDPEHVSSLSNLAVVEAERGEIRAAISLTKRALALDPSRAVAWSNLLRFCRAANDAPCVDRASARVRDASSMNAVPPPRVESAPPSTP